MNIRVEKFEVCQLSSLVKGDMFVCQNELYTVLEKTFQNVRAFNHRRNDIVPFLTPTATEVTRVKRGVIYV